MIITPTVWNQVITIMARIREEAEQRHVWTHAEISNMRENLASIEQYADEVITLLMRNDSPESLPNSQSSEVKHDNLDVGQF